MFLPALEQQLFEHAKEARLQSRKFNDSKKSLMVLRVSLIDVPLISAYVTEYLSDPFYLNPIRRNGPILQPTLPFQGTEKSNVTKTMQDNPAYAYSFNVINDILLHYFSDLMTATRSQKGKAWKESITLKAETEEWTLTNELLPQMLLGKIEKDHNSPDHTFFTKGLLTAFGRSAFTDGTGIIGKEPIGCPFGRKIASIFAIAPRRTQSGEVFISPNRTPGSLPAFIVNEYRQAKGLTIQAGVPHQATSPESHHG